MSEVEALPEVAVGWKRAKLRDVAEKPQYGLTASAAKSGPVQFLRITDIKERGVDWGSVPYCASDDKTINACLLMSGDIVFARIGATTGKSYLINDPPHAVFASYLIRVRTHRDLDPAFLSFFFKSDDYWEQVNANKHANLKKGVNGSILSDLVVPVPPKIEQERIAEVLGTVQQAMEQQERLIRSTTELKQALMQKLFTEGLRGEAQKETEIGAVPESWEVVRFDAGVNIKNGQVDPRIQPYDDMPHVGSENIESGTGRLIKIQTNKELGIGSGNYYFTPEDVLYSKIRPHLNKVALPDFEGTCSADMYPLRSEGTFNREYLFYCLLTDTFKNAAVSYQDRTGIPKINRVQLGGILLPKPSIVEQKEIAQTLTTCDRRLDCANRKRTALQDLFRTLLHELMTGKVRVG